MFTATRLAAILVATMLCAGPAMAQQRAQAPASPSSQPMAAGAAVTPAHLAVAREVAISSGLARSLNIIVPQLYDRIRAQLVTRPEVTKDLGEVLDALNPEMELQKQQMINTIARIYAVQMSEAELKEVAAFFKSPAGLKYVDTQPQVLDEMVREMQIWSQELSEYVMVRVRAEMAKRGHQIQ